MQIIMKATNMKNEYLHPDRFFDPDENVLSIARELYSKVKDLPIVSPHGHVDPKMLAENKLAFCFPYSTL